MSKSSPPKKMLQPKIIMEQEFKMTLVYDNIEYSFVGYVDNFDLKTQQDYADYFDGPMGIRSLPMVPRTTVDLSIQTYGPIIRVQH